ncbi:helix-turn-helix domain-containing protein [Mucilaginibacter pedocola]|uniref:HTH cro/C1-type domain-containing protein n=1 Tax=Mucilaginibacter pedocola TaxID=1792845 RepID=A0A1S9PHB0_9SPHI|nr:hypothetical protein BC343_25370 [Mucilaginibacter pedocola]
MFNAKALAMAIRARRLHLNYTQEYIAFRLNMSQNAYSKLELGQTVVSVNRLVQLSTIMETDLYDLLQPAIKSA